MRKRKLKRTVRFTEDLTKAITETAKARGYNSVNSFLVEAAQNEIERGGSAMKESEERMAAKMTTVFREIRKLNSVVQVGLAMHEAHIKYDMTCVQEPPEGTILESSRARALMRFEKLKRSVAHSISGGNLTSILAELMTDAERTGS